MRRLILPALIATVFAAPAFAQVNIGGAVGGAAGAANRLQVGAPLGAVGAQHTVGAAAQAGANMATPPVGQEASATARGAAQAAGNVTSSSAERAEDAAAGGGADAATQAQGVVSSDVGNGISASGDMPTGASTGTQGAEVSAAAQNAQSTGGQVGAAVRNTARENAQGINSTSQNAIDSVNDAGGQASANSELGANANGGVSANGAGTSVQGGASANANAGTRHATTRKRPHHRRASSASDGDKKQAIKIDDDVFESPAMPGLSFALVDSTRGGQPIKPARSAHRATHGRRAQRAKVRAVR
ncbi:MAG: hypothetical protein C4338_05505, partial [Rhodanobacteraceae bacterium]